MKKPDYSFFAVRRVAPLSLFLALIREEYHWSHWKVRQYA